MYIGKFKMDGKIWASIGGGSIATPKAGTEIKGDALIVAPEGSFMHLTVPMMGYTKTSFLSYTTESPPPPPPSSGGHIVEVFIDGVLEYRKELL